MEVKLFKKKSFKITKIYFLLFSLSVSYNSICQNIKIKISDLEYSFNKDSTIIIAKKDNKLINGTFVLLGNSEKEEYTVTNFIDGKAEGISRFYRNGILSGTIELKGGMKHGLNIAYDNTGEKTLWKINYYNGKQHGHSWYFDEGDVYYLNNKRVSKEEYDKYERD